MENKPFEIHSREEIFHPSGAFLSKLDKSAWDKKSILAQKDMLKFWAERAGELEWYEPWTKVLDDSNKPFYKWYIGGKVNIVHNCLDRYVKTWRRNKLALIWEGETGDQRAFSYHALNREVCKFASVIKAMGITKGDRVTIYLPSNSRNYNCNAGMCKNRGCSFCSIWRILGRIVAWPDS